MQSENQIAPSKAALWTGRVLTGFAALFLLVDSIMKVVKAAPVVEATAQLGYPVTVVFGIGMTLLVCTIIYLIPRTSVFGAVLLTGYLGGAIATNVRVSSPLFTHTLFPIYVAILIWGGLYLRDEKLRALIPFRK
jgi:hypothetical protein